MCAEVENRTMVSRGKEKAPGRAFETAYEIVLNNYRADEKPRLIDLYTLLSHRDCFMPHLRNNPPSDAFIVRFPCDYYGLRGEYHARNNNNSARARALQLRLEKYGRVYSDVPRE